jgi:hypothetical protein
VTKNGIEKRENNARQDYTEKSSKNMAHTMINNGGIEAMAMQIPNRVKK